MSQIPEILPLISDSGKEVPNQYIIKMQDGSQFFQSYGTLIAKIDAAGKIMVTAAWDYSQTTVKYLKQFLGTSLTKAQIKKRIDAGEIQLVSDLN